LSNQNIILHGEGWHGVKKVFIGSFGICLILPNSVFSAGWSDYFNSGAAKDWGTLDNGINSTWGVVDNQSKTNFV